MPAPAARYLLLGNPVAESLSPVMHNAALAAAGVAARYETRETGPEDLATVLEAAVVEGCRGFNITVPLKVVALRHCHRLAPEVALTGAVNTIVLKADALTGHNTDVTALRVLIGEWAALGGRRRPPFRALILGAGGAARAAAVAAALAGAGVVVIAARDQVLARRAADDLLERLHAVRPDPAREVRLSGVSLDRAFRDPTGADVVVQATSAPDGHLAPYPAWVPGSLAVELNYRPHRTRFLVQAAAAGAVCVGGAEVLLRQGELAFELFTGRPAPTGVMRGALEEEVTRRAEIGHGR